MSKPCTFAGCKEMVLAVLPCCEYCEGRFCTKHLLPEVHGCGVDARVEAKRQATNDAIAQRKARKNIGNDEAKKKLQKRIQQGEADRQKKSVKKN